jgi:hypothetical protein
MPITGRRRGSGSILNIPKRKLALSTGKADE